MPLDIALVFVILVAAVVLFVSERLRPDLVAVLVLVSLAVSGLVSPREAISGFSNPAVVTVWAVFILSGALSRTGIAGLVGRQILRLAGGGEARLILAIMITAGLLSSFMNNVGVAALLLPVVMDISRSTGTPPSRLLIPLAYSCLLGGLTTLIGTPPNLLVNQALAQAELPRFAFFDFTPVGASVLLAGTCFMALFGRRLLPEYNVSALTTAHDLQQLYQLRERLFVLRVPRHSVLVGKTLAESRVGTLLGVHVLGILRQGRTILAPSPDTVLSGGDRLIVEGRIGPVSEMQQGNYLTVEEQALDAARLVSKDVELAEVAVSPTSRLIGRTLSGVDFRRRYGANVLAIWRRGVFHFTHLSTLTLQSNDVLLVHVPRDRIDELAESDDLIVADEEAVEVERLANRLLVVGVAPDSALVGKSLSESQLAALGFNVLGIVRGGETQLMPEADQPLEGGDTLLVEGGRSSLETLEGVQSLEVDADELGALGEIESANVGLAEVVLSPRSTLAGRSLVELHFRERYGLSVIAVTEDGEIRRTELRERPLRFGDALLVHGPRQRIELLAADPDFLVLSGEAQPAPRLRRAPIAGAIMSGVVLSVLLLGAEVYIATIAGALLMVLTGCLTMDEAYESIEWRAVFLIAGMMPLGIALESSGAARFVTEGVVALVGGYGELAVVIGLYAVTAVAAQVMPTAAVAILLAPIALNTAQDLGLSPHALMMTVALAASASFMSPVAHPANVLIMGPGGYRFRDYVRVGLPLTFVCLLVVLVALPFFWPLTLAP